MPTLRDRLEHLAYRGLAGLVRVLPERAALAFGAALGWLGATVLRVRRRVVDENLRHAYPEKDASWRRRVAVGSYVHLLSEAIMTMRLGRAEADVLRARVDDGAAPILEAIGRGNGVVIVTGHLGNWELAGAFLAARGVELDVVATTQRNPLFDRDLVENRRRLGMRVIPRRGAPKRVLRSLREGRVPALVADQNAGSRGLFVRFFGRLASTHRGPALFARRVDARLFVGVCVARPTHPRSYRILVREVPMQPSAEVADDVARITQAHTALLEEWVRDWPEQYLWHHKRWKTRPPEEPASRPVYYASPDR